MWISCELPNPKVSTTIRSCVLYSMVNMTVQSICGQICKRDLLRIIYVICAWATSLNCEDNTVSLHTITRKHFSFTYCSLKLIYASLQLHNQIYTLDPNCISGHFWDLHKVAINFACEFCGCFIIPSLKISWMLLKTAIC